MDDAHAAQGPQEAGDAQHAAAPGADPSAVLRDARRRLAPDPRANRLVPMIGRGAAPVHVLGAFAAEQHRIVSADAVAFRHLAERAERDGGAAGGAPVAGWFRALAAGEDEALRRLVPLARACGLDGAAVARREPLPGCQAYAGFNAWLALNAAPADAALAVAANFTAFGGYCSAIARALREQYRFTDEACGFFDLFAAGQDDAEEDDAEEDGGAGADDGAAGVDDRSTAADTADGPAAGRNAPAPPQDGADAPVVAALTAGAAAGAFDPERAVRLGRLLRAYELMFWDTLADVAAAPYPSADTPPPRAPRRPPPGRSAAVR